MQPLKQIATSTTDEIVERKLTLFLHSAFCVLTGQWYWDLHADSVFCSDVMWSVPADFRGTSGIIHPDDLPFVEHAVQGDENSHINLSYRMITTYGAVVHLQGENIKISHLPTAPEDVERQLEQESIADVQLRKAYETLQLEKDIFAAAERLTGVGTWYYNTVTHITWFSDQVYRIHGLAPNSINAHLGSFNQSFTPMTKRK